MPVAFDAGRKVTQTDVAISESESVIIPANVNRKTFKIANNSTTQDVYISYGITAVVGRGKIIQKNGGYFEDDTGSGQAIHAIGSGADAGLVLSIFEVA